MPGAMLLAMLLKGSLHECHAGPRLAATCSCFHAHMATPYALLTAIDLLQALVQATCQTLGTHASYRTASAA